MWSREVLIVRGLAFIVVFVLETSNNNQVILIQRSQSIVISKTRLALLSIQQLIAAVYKRRLIMTCLR